MLSLVLIIATSALAHQVGELPGPDTYRGETNAKRVSEAKARERDFREELNSVGLKITAHTSEANKLMAQLKPGIERAANLQVSKDLAQQELTRFAADKTFKMDLFIGGPSFQDLPLDTFDKEEAVAEKDMHTLLFNKKYDWDQEKEKLEDEMSSRQVLLAAENLELEKQNKRKRELEAAIQREVDLIGTLGY